MLIARRLMRYAYIILIVTLILINPLAVQKAEGSSSLNYEVPVYNIAISEETQRDIWKLCEENHLSYELVLAIYQIEGTNSIQIEDIKAEIGKLVYIRDYWTEQGVPDEIVFDLMLLSRERGIEGGIVFMEDRDSYDLGNYVQKVTEYKYNLEQSLDAPPVSKNGRTLVPVRALPEKSGANVEWDKKIQTAKITKGYVSVESFVGKTNAEVNRQIMFFKAPAKIKDDITLVSIKFLSEAYNLKPG